MKTHTLNSEQIKEVVMLVTGSINPVGDASRDDERFENLKLRCDVVDKLVIEIDNVSYNNGNSQEHSVKRASEYASNFLTNRLGIK